MPCTRLCLCLYICGSFLASESFSKAAASTWLLSRLSSHLTFSRSRASCSFSLPPSPQTCNVGVTGYNGSVRLSQSSDSFLGTNEQIAVFALLLHLPLCSWSHNIYWQVARWVKGTGTELIIQTWKTAVTHQLHPLPVLRHVSASHLAVSYQNRDILHHFQLLTVVIFI